jgi:hypothetical protein
MAKETATDIMMKWEKFTRVKVKIPHDEANV